MLTYENFITNLFTKRKILPIEMQTLASTVFDIVDYYIINEINEVDKGWNVEIIEQKPQNKKNDNQISIYIDPKDLGSGAKIVGLYYKEDIKRVMFVFIDVSKDMRNLEEFITNMLKPFEAQKHNNHLNDDYYFFIPLDKIQSVIDEMTIENLKYFLTEKKYNL